MHSVAVGGLPALMAGLSVEASGTSPVARDQLLLTSPPTGPRVPGRPHEEGRARSPALTARPPTAPGDGPWHASSEEGAHAGLARAPAWSSGVTSPWQLQALVLSLAGAAALVHPRARALAPMMLDRLPSNCQDRKARMMAG